MQLAVCLIFTLVCIHIWASFLYKPYGSKVANWFGMIHSDYVEFFILATLFSPITIPILTIGLWYIFLIS